MRLGTQTNKKRELDLQLATKCRIGSAPSSKEHFPLTNWTQYDMHKSCQVTPNWQHHF